MKRRLTKVEKVLILTALLAGGLYFYLNKVYDPAAKVFEKKNKEIATLQQEIAGLGGMEAEYVSKKVARCKKEVSDLNQALAGEIASKKAETDAGVTGVLAEVTRLALVNGMDVKQMGFKEVKKAAASPARPHEVFDWQAYTLDLEGSYWDLDGFIRSLSEMDKAVVVESIQVKAGEKPGIFNVTLGIFL